MLEGDYNANKVPLTPRRDGVRGPSGSGTGAKIQGGVL